MTIAFDHLFLAPSNFDKALSFYQGVLGFAVDHKWGENGEPRGAALSLGLVKVVLGENHSDQEDDAWISGVRGNTPTVHIKCSNIADVYAQLLNRGAEIVVPLQLTHWGVNWLVTSDPDGNLLAFFEEPKAES